MSTVHSTILIRKQRVIPALIARMIGAGGGPVKVWGDGSAIRDFVYSEDVAYWLLKAVEKAPPGVA